MRARKAAWATMVPIGCALVTACATESSGKREEAAHASSGADAGASTGGTAATGSVSEASAGGADGSSCVSPPSIDPATWPTCSTTSGGAAEPVPTGVVLAQSADDQLGQVSWAGAYLYFADRDCSCVGPCPMVFESCPWSIDFVDACSQVRTAVASGQSYQSRIRPDIGFQFASTADFVFWVTYGESPVQYPMLADMPSVGRGALYRSAAGGTQAVRLRGSEAGVARTFEQLTARGDRLYWIESAWSCPANVTTYNDCSTPPGRLVAAPATSDSLPDSALTVLYDWADAPDASPDRPDPSSIYTLAVDDTHVYLLDGGAVHRIPLTGGPAERFASCITNGSALAVDDAYVYVAEFFVPADGGFGEYVIQRISKQSGTCERLTTSTRLDFSAQDGFVYTVEPGEGSCTTTVHKIPRTGGPSQIVVSAAFGNAYPPMTHDGRLLVHFYDSNGAFGTPSSSTVVEIAR